MIDNLLVYSVLLFAQPKSSPSTFLLNYSFPEIDFQFQPRHFPTIDSQYSTKWTGKL